MSFRPKTTRRLAILAVIAVVIVGGGSAVVSMRLRQFHVMQLQTRAQGFEAYRHGDYPTAVAKFHRYFGSLDGDDSAANADAPAVFAYAYSQARVPGSDLSYLVTAKSIFGRYLELMPNDAAAEHELLSIYRRLGYDSQTAPLADALLRQDANDLPALRARLHLQAESGHPAEALATVLHINELAPLDLQSQITALRLMKINHQPASQIVDRANALMAAHPDDARFLVLRGIASDLAGDDNAAAQFLRQAAASTSLTEDAEVLTLAGAMDRLGLGDDATALLSKKADASPPADSTIESAMLQRQWERGDNEAVLWRLAGLAPTTEPSTTSDPAVSPDSTLLALQALALYTRDTNGDRAQAGAIVSALAQRRADIGAMAWTDLLRARFSTPPVGPPAAAQLCRAAAALAPDNAVARDFLGLCEEDVQEGEAAIQAWHEAADLAPAWASPHILAAKELLAEHRPAAAEADTSAAIAAAPPPTRDAADAQALAITAIYAKLAVQASAQDLQAVLNRADNIATRLPQETSLIPIRVDLLARGGNRQDATALATHVLADQPAVSSDILASLAQVVARDRLSVADALADAILRRRPTTYSEGLAQARALATLGRSDAGMHRLAAEAMAHPNSPRWRMVLLQFRQETSTVAPALPAQLQETKKWAALADGCPSDPIIQRAALDAPVAWNDRTVIARSIERLRHLTGEQGIGWRLAQARFQLSAPDEPKGAAADAAAAASASMAEVVRLAPELVEPRILWAQALQKLGDHAGASIQLHQAAALDPNNPAVAAQLSQLLTLQSEQKPQAATQPATPDRESASLNLSH